MICSIRHLVARTPILWLGGIIPLLMGATVVGQFTENSLNGLPATPGSTFAVITTELTGSSLQSVPSKQSVLQSGSKPNDDASTSKLRIAPDATLQSSLAIASGTKNFTQPKYVGKASLEVASYQTPVAAGSAKAKTASNQTGTQIQLQAYAAPVNPFRKEQAHVGFAPRVDTASKNVASGAQATRSKKVANPYRDARVKPILTSPSKKKAIAVATGASPSRRSKLKRLPAPKTTRPTRAVVSHANRRPANKNRNQLRKNLVPEKLGIKPFADAKLTKRTSTEKADHRTLQAKQQASKKLSSKRRASPRIALRSVQGTHKNAKQAADVLPTGSDRQLKFLPPVEKVAQTVPAPAIQQPKSVQFDFSPKHKSPSATLANAIVQPSAVNTASATLPSPISLPAPLTASLIPGFDNSSDTNAKIVFRPAVPSQDENGRLILRPKVRLAGGEYLEEVISTPTFESAPGQVYLAPDTFQGQLPDLQSIPLEGGACVSCGDSVGGCVGATPCEVSWCQKMNGKCKARLYNLCGACPSQDIGIGRSRLPFAPFFIERSQPLPNHVSFRLDAGWDYDDPVRSEYFLGNPQASGVEPPPNMNFQEFRLSFELGSNKFSTITELPIRGLDPSSLAGEDADSGFGDMAVGTRLVMLDGKVWQITQLFRTTFNTGDVNKGLGTGHISLEPGIAYRIKLTEDSFFYGDVKLNIPVGADPKFAGEVANYGIGISRVYIDADDFAILPTLELVAWSFLDGKGVGDTNEIDVANLYPGVRIVCDRGGDIPIWELGIATGFPITSAQLYSNILRVDLRWNF